MTVEPDAERRRLAEAKQGSARWYRWGPYLADRQWGTVREDYSERGDAWDYFPHDHARSRAYRWGEDGLLGIADDQARLCFGLALWNGRDPILKERLFGLTGGRTSVGSAQVIPTGRREGRERGVVRGPQPSRSPRSPDLLHPLRPKPRVSLVLAARERFHP